MQRKDFVRLAALGGLGLCVGSCTSRKTTKPEAAVVAPAVLKIKDSDVVFFRKGDARYEKLRMGFNLRINKFPEEIALCKTTEGVAVALQQARKKGLPVAVKSGGHCMEGFSVNDGGMVINVSALNNISWGDNETIKTGPGAKLSELYDFMLPQNKLLPAGACGGVGIGGLSLGGGYGFFSRKWGLTCDNLTQLKMVDGNGNIHFAKDNDELLWANRGGGTGNFGIVTELNFKTYPKPAGFQSHRFRAFNAGAERAVGILKQWFAITANLPLSCFSAFVMNGKTIYILVTNYEGHTDELQNVLNELTSITDKSVHGQSIETAKALKNFYGLAGPLIFKNSCAGLYSDFSEIENCINNIAQTVIDSPGLIYQVNTMGGNISNKNFEAVSAYPHRSKSYVSELQAYWTEPNHGSRLMNAFQKVQNIFYESGIISQYCNYPCLEFKNWQQAYYGANYARLQSIKKKYDPDNIIRHEQSIRA